jgi:isoaspartyl peptidase/L-asparaginase-like protein (Ntn-hydrolase superfamily)
MLAGPDADAFADAQGFAEEPLLSPAAREKYRAWLAAQEEEAPPAGHDTVGVLCLDRAGVLSGACSTSGMAYKLPGRVGDSPIVGHGLYVDPRHGAAVATGLGELVMGLCSSFLAVEEMRRGASPRDALVEALSRIAGAYALRERHQVGMIALAPTGAWAGAALRPGYATSLSQAGRHAVVPPEVALLAG